MKRRSYLSLIFALCASTVLPSCTSPVGRVRHLREQDLTRRLDPDYKPNKETFEENELAYEAPEIDILTGKPIYKIPRLELIARRLLKEHVKKAYYPDEWPYRLWQFGNDVSDWIDENIKEIDLGDFKGNLTADTSGRVGITLSAEF